MRTRHDACPSEVTLTPDEIGQLEPLPEPLFALETQLRCELQAQHRGPHLALAQASGWDGRWMRWADGHRDLAVIRGHCPAEQGGTADRIDGQVPCELPPGHPGCHRFEMDKDAGGTTPGAWRLQPCPSWCTGEHALLAGPQDGFHHCGRETAILLTHSQRTGKTDVLTAGLVAFVPSVAGSPWPPRVEVSVNKYLAFELTPAEARRLAAILTGLSSQAEAEQEPKPG
jgi:hypothetical protein